jgi:nitric oxide reductase subunit B
MNVLVRNYIRVALILLALTLILGMVSSWAFIYPENYTKWLPFHQLHALHVSAAIFWIITAATASIIYLRKNEFKTSGSWHNSLFMILWLASIIAVFICYALKKFGGREYWEFPPYLSLPLLLSWILFMIGYYRDLRRVRGRVPLYVVMWSTGILFFLITFLEQYVWQIPWFRESFLKEITVQWKANGSMVGAWNQMIYGTLFFLMVKLGGDETVISSRKAKFFYFLGLTNLMFNWGHHIYNVPGAAWIRHVGYAVSMTEWLFLINILYGFRAKLSEAARMRHFIVYRFMFAAEIWVLANLLLAIMMSVPAINRYTHGTHITVAHAMGATIGINTMILLAGLGYIIDIENITAAKRKIVFLCFSLTQVSLIVFWAALIAAGLIKGYRSVAMHITNFSELMAPVMPLLKVFAVAGIGLAMGLIPIIGIYLAALAQKRKLPGGSFQNNPV